MLMIVAGEDRAQVAIATFDSTIHFYTLRAAQTQPQMLVVPDIADPYAPPAASIISNAKASRHVVCAYALPLSCAAPYSRVSMTRCWTVYGYTL